MVCGRVRTRFFFQGARVSHSAFYMLICVAVMAAVRLLGAPEFSVLVCVAAFLVAILGVPHGGLDHWTGRRLLASRFRDSWWMMFFPGYLAVGLIVAIAWFVFPVATVIGFFLLSAWHFGREDQHRLAKRSGGPHSWVMLEHLSAIALGGLVIWIPALVRTEEMTWMLRMIVPSKDAGVAEQIVFLTRSIAMVLCPVALVACLSKLKREGQDLNVWVPVATAGIAVIAPILVSFTAYFCLWHSILGLSRLRSQEGLKGPQFVASILPLSLMAVAGVIAAGWFFRQSVGPSSVGTVPESLQTLFIGLSAIAVPHLLLHEWAGLARRPSYRPETQS
jgi:hypothetical protein